VHHEVALISTVAVGLLYALIGGYFASRLRLPPAGEFAFGIADTEDFYMAVKEGKPVGALFPDQETFGTLVIPNALVLVANTPNPEQGKQFIDFLLRPEIQKVLATGDPG
jgi:ABC-type Fe3+ transport system substrate-binding protein